MDSTGSCENYLLEIFFSLRDAVEETRAVAQDGGATIGDSAAPVAASLQRLAPRIDLPPPIVRQRVHLTNDSINLQISFNFLDLNCLLTFQMKIRIKFLK